MFVVITIYLKPLEEVNKWYPEHFAWLEKYYASGHFLGSGRRVPPVGGIIIARAESQEALRSILDEGGAGEFVRIRLGIKRPDLSIDAAEARLAARTEL